MTLSIPDHIREQLWKLAIDSPSYEICGVITRQGMEWSRIIPMRNSAQRSDVRFQFDPVDQLATWQEIEDLEEDVLAIYHSHIATEAVPSPMDVMYAQPGIFQIIISLTERKIRAFLVYPKGEQRCVNEVPLEIGSDGVRVALKVYGLISPTMNMDQEMPSGM